MITETTTGLIAEHIAAAALLSQGWRVSMAQQDKVDLVAWKDDKFIRVQVKGSNIRTESQRKTGYQFQFGSGSKKKKLPTIECYDLLVMVGIQHRRCMFLATEQVKQYSKRISTRRFEDEMIEEESLSKALEIINGRLGKI